MLSPTELATEFGRAWRNPSPETLTSLLHPETTLYQPHLKPIYGKENAYREFALFLNWMPSFTGDVKMVAVNSDILFIEWQMNFHFRNKPFGVQAVDRIIMDGGLIRERHVLFNPLILIRKIAPMPGEWRAYLKYRFAARPA